MLQEVDQVVVVLRRHLSRRELLPFVPAATNAADRRLGMRVSHLLLVLEVGHSLLESLNDSLAVVRALGQLLLHFLMDVDIAAQRLNLLLVLVVLHQELLRLLRLELELCRQLRVLQNGQPRRGLQLLLVKSQQVSLGLLDLKEHLFPELLGGLDLLALLGSDLLVALLDLILQLGLQVDLLLLKGALLLLKQCHLIVFLFDLLQSVLDLGNLVVLCLLQITHSFIVIRLVLDDLAL